MKRECKECGQTLVGRSDKKFCDDQCRSGFNNKSRYQQNISLRVIDRILKKNYAVLKKLSLNRNHSVSREQMLMSGFDFRYHTHRVDMHDPIVFFCYDLGYITESHEKIMLVGNGNQCFKS